MDIPEYRLTSGEMTVYLKEPGGSISLSKLFAALQRSQAWISNYAVARLGPGISPFDFTEPLQRRLQGRVSDLSSDDEVDEVLKTHVRYLVKEQHRVELKKAKPLVREQEAGEIPDPRGLSWVDEFERKHDSRVALELLQSLDEDRLNLLRQVYSCDSDEDSRAELAKRMGLTRNTLNKRLSRILKDLRSGRLEKSARYPMIDGK